MKKRIAALASALVMGMSAVPFVSSALYISNEEEAVLEDYIYCEDLKNLYNIETLGKYDKMFVKNDGWHIKILKKANDYIFFNLAEGVSYDDVVNAYYGTVSTESGDNYAVPIVNSISSTAKNYAWCIKGPCISENDARSFCNMLKEQGLITGFCYAGQRYFERTLDFMEPINKKLFYSQEPSRLVEIEDDLYKKISVADVVEEYLADGDKTAEDSGTCFSGWYVDRSEKDGFAYLTTDKDVNTYQILLVLQQVITDTGCLTGWGYGEDGSAKNLTDTIVDNEVVDIYNSIDGDANNDGELRLNDAVLIMQAIGNPGEYQLDAQQRFNADIYGNGDGLTNMDALTVQRKLIGLE